MNGELGTPRSWEDFLYLVAVQVAAPEVASEVATQVADRAVNDPTLPSSPQVLAAVLARRAAGELKRRGLLENPDAPTAPEGTPVTDAELTAVGEETMRQAWEYATAGLAGADRVLLAAHLFGAIGVTALDEQFGKGAARRVTVLRDQVDAKARTADLAHLPSVTAWAVGAAITPGAKPAGSPGADLRHTAALRFPTANTNGPFWQNRQLLIGAICVLGLACVIVGILIFSVGGKKDDPDGRPTPTSSSTTTVGKPATGLPDRNADLVASPPAITLTGATPGTFEISNTTSRAITVELRAPVGLTVAPSAATISAEGSVGFTVTADPSSIGDQDAQFAITVTGGQPMVIAVLVNNEAPPSLGEVTLTPATVSRDGLGCRSITKARVTAVDPDGVSRVVFTLTNQDGAVRTVTAGPDRTAGSYVADISGGSTVGEVTVTATATDSTGAGASTAAGAILTVTDCDPTTTTTAPRPSTTTTRPTTTTSTPTSTSTTTSTTVGDEE